MCTQLGEAFIKMKGSHKSTTLSSRNVNIFVCRCPQGSSSFRCDLCLLNLCPDEDLESGRCGVGDVASPMPTFSLVHIGQERQASFRGSILGLSGLLKVQLSKPCVACSAPPGHLHPHLLASLPTGEPVSSQRAVSERQN